MNEPTIISEEQQKDILLNVKVLATKSGVFDEERAHILLIGVYVALQKALPPFWVANIMCKRIDRLFSS